MRTGSVRNGGHHDRMPETTATRLLRLLPLLTSRPAWRGEELAEALGVTPRTVRRDVERLRDLGYPVAATPGSHGGYSLRAGNGLPPLLLDDDSAVAVAIGLRTVAARGMEEAAARAAAAIDQVLPARLRHRVEALTATTVPLPAAYPSISHNDLAFLAQACHSAERRRFVYRDGSGTETRCHAEPYRLVSTGQRWFLVARDINKKEWRSFRVDRVESPAGTGVRTRPADPPDAARFVSERISTGPYRWRARALLDAPAEVVATMVPSTVAVIEAVDEHRCVLTSGSDSLDSIALHLAHLGIPFIPLDPPELRARCAALAERLHAAATNSQ